MFAVKRFQNSVDAIDELDVDRSRTIFVRSNCNFVFHGENGMTIILTYLTGNVELFS